MAHIILYTTHCPLCNALKQMLDTKKLSYDICDDRKKMIELGFRSAPTLQVEGSAMDFKDAVNWLNGSNK